MPQSNSLSLTDRNSLDILSKYKCAGLELDSFIIIMHVQSKLVHFLELSNILGNCTVTRDNNNSNF